MKSRLSLCALTTCLVFSPVAASAHLMATGLGPVFDGVSHFGLSPEDFLPVIALGLFAGLRGARHSRLTMLALTFAWFAGGLAAMLGLVPPDIAISASTAAILMIVGGVLAANLNLPPAVCALLGIALGGLRGMADLAGVDESVSHILTLIGMSAAVFAVFAIATSLTLPLQRLWIIVATRVGGSWIAALGLLLAGWILRYGAVVR